MSDPIRIDQDAFGVQGNCQSACLAMLLGLPLAEVPNFTLEADDAARSAAMHNWLLARGLGLVRVSPSRHAQVGFYIGGGMSPRGIPHAVIYKDGLLWHDPHPERGGIEKLTEIDVIYALRPFDAPKSSSANPGKCLAAIDQIAREVRSFGAEMFVIENVRTAKAAIDANDALRDLCTAIHGEGCQTYEWPRAER